ncbi:MAG: energy-coupling factor transporter transmembrane protein EcfT [Proteobacteria bacterium]|nr:energy-coupling factor transporter transmembrane protein EcfT [Pseudomonadota bacterium]
MAELTAFSYRSGASALHRLDVRFKLVFVIMLGLASLKGYAPYLLVLTVILLVLVKHAGIGAKSILGLFRHVIFILGLVFIARALSTPGTAVWKIMAVTVTREGIYDGLIVCWRLSTVIMISFAFVATTRPSEIKAAVEWFLRPLPFVPEKRLSIMMSLIMRFLPVIFEEARETVDAQRARGVENRKNPVYRIRKLAIPLLRRIFERADKLALAMEARCYSEKRTDPELYARPRDWIAFLIVMGMCTFSVAI